MLTEKGHNNTRAKNCDLRTLCFCWNANMTGFYRTVPNDGVENYLMLYVRISAQYNNAYDFPVKASQDLEEQVCISPNPSLKVKWTQMPGFACNLHTLCFFFLIYCKKQFALTWTFGLNRCDYENLHLQYTFYLTCWHFIVWFYGRIHKLKPRCFSFNKLSFQ